MGSSTVLRYSDFAKMALLPPKIAYSVQGPARLMRDANHNQIGSRRTRRENARQTEKKGPHFGLAYLLHEQFTGIIPWRDVSLRRSLATQYSTTISLRRREDLVTLLVADNCTS